MEDDDLEYLAGRQRPFGDKYGLGRVALAALILGTLGGGHLVLLVENSLSRASWQDSARSTAWALYVVLLAAFHFLEFACTALYRWRDLSYDSFLLNHSVAYSLALGASLAEFAVESAFFSPPALAICLGLGLVVFGQALRVVAMATAQEHFAHRIMIRKHDGHRLVTHGVYALLRHPAYTGWFWWSIGTQILLANPVCLVGYAWASWAFFNDRIPYEEATLLAFYPNDYPRYAKSTWLLIPFIESDPGNVAKESKGD